MKEREKAAARDAAIRSLPFFCGGHTILAVPFDELNGDELCNQCEMDSECKGDIFEMCEFVNGFRGHDEYFFKFNVAKSINK